jgi:hypothetical protein
MLDEGALGRGRRGSRTPEYGGNSSNQSPHPASRRKKRRTERRRSRTLGRRQRALSAGLMFTSPEYARTRRPVAHEAPCPLRPPSPPPAGAPGAAPPLRPRASRTPPGSRASASHPGTGSNHTTPRARPSTSSPHSEQNRTGGGPRLAAALVRIPLPVPSVELTRPPSIASPTQGAELRARSLVFSPALDNRHSHAWRPRTPLPRQRSCGVRPPLW